MNAYTELLLAGYIVAIILAGKEDDFFELVSKEKGFLKWAISFGLVVLITDQFGKPGKQFMTLVIVAMVMIAVNKNPKVFDNLTKVLQG